MLGCNVLSNINTNSGGNGGQGGANGVGGNGASYTAVNTVGGSTTGMLYLQQDVTGGNGGISQNGVGGNGGNARSDLTYTDASGSIAPGFADGYTSYAPNALASNLLGSVAATAGNGSQGGTTAGLGGNATSNIALTSVLNGAVVVTQAKSIGGLGGYIPNTSVYGVSGVASATAYASGVRGTASNTVSTSASSPTVTGSALWNQSASAMSGVGGSYTYDTAVVNTLGIAPGRSISEGVAAPTISGTNTNAALVTTSYMGSIISPTSTPYGFTEVGTGYMGAQANGVAGSNTYNMSAEYVLSSSLVGSGKELLFGSGGPYQYGTTAMGSGFDSLSLTITDKNSSGLYTLTKTFTSYSSFATFLAAGVDLGNSVSGAQDVSITMAETLSGSNGAAALYVLAVTPYANGGYTNQMAVVATPIPAALPLFASGLLCVWAIGRKRGKTIA